MAKAPKASAPPPPPPTTTPEEAARAAGDGAASATKPPEGATGATAPAPAPTPSVDDLVKGMEEGTLELSGDALTVFKAGSDAGRADAEADENTTTEGVSFDDDDDNYFRAGYLVAFHATRREQTKAAADAAFGGKGDHDNNGAAGGNIVADPEYKKGYDAGLLYDGPQSDAAAFKGDESVAYKAGFREGKVKRDSGDKRDLLGDKVPNTLEYDNGYHAGWASGKTGVPQRDPAVEYSEEFNDGYNTGKSDASENRDFDEGVRNVSELARDNSQAEVDGMSTEDRLCRIEKTLGLMSPTKA